MAKIAGHEVSRISLSFFLDPNNPTNSDLAQLYLVHVVFNLPNKSGGVVLDDLAKKLEHLYGPGKKEGNNGALIFEGKNDTAIYLSGWSNSVYLTYYKTDSIDAIENFISNSSTAEVAEDYSGL